MMSLQRFENLQVVFQMNEVSAENLKVRDETCKQ